MTWRSLVTPTREVIGEVVRRKSDWSISKENWKQRVHTTFSKSFSKWQLKGCGGSERVWKQQHLLSSLNYSSQVITHSFTFYSHFGESKFNTVLKDKNNSNIAKGLLSLGLRNKAIFICC